MPLSGPLTQRADALATELRGLGVRAITDPADALANLPCVLVAPPRIDYRAQSVSWRLLVLGPGPGTLAGWDAIDKLLGQLVDQVPLETADPASHQLPNVGDAVACYVATYTETL